ncbi:YdgH/BhsA/McbA-like domain containing protein [Sodalis sp. dw_96]|uniref:multiple stress resistance protein BhsA n=1 Tax=Sodalis sp. dw_96 TaxID=2719794 RepID=UPI001BD49952|nr:YdgH/BhsA/McbA-like domain containing protein [Sodalis sp. dw_96]
MKNLKLAIAAIALSTLSFASLAAQEVNSQPANEQSVGMVSATTTGSLNDLQTELAAKAQAADASSYRIVAAGGNNTLRGSAELYK